MNEGKGELMVKPDYITTVLDLLHLMLAAQQETNDLLLQLIARQAGGGEVT